ncbi:MAG: bifunctional diaminohydroxyphosphoribosylaminopyrimidine deaminase/5-amino-6-(5-phosphoribosylamino)uracil reductase RibD [Flavobacteriales bacterium]|nr:bifunctional diaminohydroxyphosphoribosylaminopyrimidine deaminase/5-amino-6-(5-phosphoribosylamino)uracil reductase RibD [Flavobacteriales bacterium]MBT6745855.1 bifunctional diaminohydroxyphosphoribosylaminopyrimidine deaminase/5-amino-6-(5-phosphoribosylamino)uracil reductase RibD [Flavobacteriales bacterium]
MKTNEAYMQRCIDISKNGLRNAMPNPSVGAVIVHDGKIIGEGYTSPYGGNHAEVNAINSVNNKNLLPQSTIYVSLEPCSHIGKTPPCTELIAKHKLKAVVIGCTDSNSLVCGNGIKKLKDTGCKVITGVLEKECKESNKRFFTFQEKKRPYVILKWAQSADGFIDKTRISSKIPSTKITSQTANTLVHKWRSEEMAIMVGTNTILLDNPTLTVRYLNGKNPIRVVIDREYKLPKSSNIFNNSSPTICYTSTISHKENDIEWVRINFTNALEEILKDLHQRNILSLFVEGGRQVLQSFIDANLWDESRVFTSDLEIESGVKAPEINIIPLKMPQIGVDKLALYRND